METLLSAQFCCESHTALKNKVFFFFSKDKRTTWTRILGKSVYGEKGAQVRKKERRVFFFFFFFKFQGAP